MNNVKVDEIASQIADAAEECCEVANGEFVDFDWVGAKAAAIEGLHRYFSGPAEIEESVINKILERRGTKPEVDLKGDLEDLGWMRAAQEQAIDTAIFLEKLIQKHE